MFIVNILGKLLYKWSNKLPVSMSISYLAYTYDTPRTILMHFIGF